MKNPPNELSRLTFKDQPGTETEARFNDSVEHELVIRAVDISAHEIEEITTHQTLHGGGFLDTALSLKLVEQGVAEHLRALKRSYPFIDGYASQIRSSELVTALDPFGEPAAAFRDARTEILMNGRGDEQATRCICVVSPNAGEGRSFVTANLAVSLSQLGSRTLLVDADLRHPRQHELFGVPNQWGLSSYLGGDTNRLHAQSVNSIPGLYVLTAGPAVRGAVELLHRPALRALLHRLSERFDHVLIDTPAIAQYPDARLVAEAAGAALIVGCTGKVALEDLDRLVLMLEQSSTSVAGILMNGR
jgi:receptor protein-tyrosine kinase